MRHNIFLNLALYFSYFYRLWKKFRSQIIPTANRHEHNMQTALAQARKRTSSNWSEPGTSTERLQVNPVSEIPSQVREELHDHPFQAPITVLHKIRRFLFRQLRPKPCPLKMTCKYELRYDRLKFEHYIISA